MIDADAVLIEALSAQAALTALTGSRIYASLYPPKGYKPDDGQMLLFSPRTGGGPDYSRLVWRTPYQFRSFGKTQALAKELDRVLYDLLDEFTDCNIKMALAEAVGQPLLEPSTGWPFVLSYYTITFNQES